MEKKNNPDYTYRITLEALEEIGGACSIINRNLLLIIKLLGEIRGKNERIG